jgi:hypothetical protein
MSALCAPSLLVLFREGELYLSQTRYTPEFLAMILLPK